MSKQKDNEAGSKFAQILAALNIESTLSEKYAEQVLDKQGNINYQISARTILGSAKSDLLGCTVLHLAHKKQKLKLFNLLLDHGANFTIKNKKGSTVLHQIIEDSYKNEAEISVLEANNPYITPVLDALVKSGNSCFDLKNKKGITHFQIACMANHKAAIELFLTVLKDKAFINWFVAKDSSMFPGYTALHFAARFSSLDAVKILLKSGAMSNVKDMKKMTPLHVSIKQNIEITDLLNRHKVENAEQLIARRKANEAIIRLLLSRVSERKGAIDDTNLTRLHIACVMESYLVLNDNLLGNIDYINQAVTCSSSSFSGNTALHFAALCNVKKVKLLLQNRANIHLLNAKKQTAFHLCVERYQIEDIHDIISIHPDWSKIQLYTEHKKTLLDLLSSMQSLDFQSSKKYINAWVDKNSPLWPTFRLLHLAVIFSERDREGDDMLIEKIIQEESTSISVLAKHNTSPLHLAFRLKKEKVVNYLLTVCQTGANFIDNDNLSHFHIACAAGLTSIVEEFLLGGAEVNAPVKASYGWYRHPQCMARGGNASREVFIPTESTPLHIAVIVGHLETMKLLVNYGADVYAKDGNGMTPIHWLVVSDNPISPVADVLLSTSKPTSSTSTSNDNKRFATSSTLKECVTNTGLSHLHVACFANNATAVEQLLKGGSKINAISFRAAGDNMRKFPGRVRYAGYTPLHFALEGKCEKTIDLLIRHEAQVLTKNPIKNSIPLYEALIHKNSPGAGAFVEFFKSNRALQIQFEDNLYMTRLHFYCCSLDDKAAEDLLKDDAAVVKKYMPRSSPVWPGFTPLHVLMRFYDTSNSNADALLKLLLKYGANVTSSNAEKNTPVHLAYELDVAAILKAPLLKQLLRSQDNFVINPQNKVSLSHFHLACAICDIETIEKFLKCDVDVNQPIDYFYENRDDGDSGGCTPLHLVLFSPLNEDVEVTVKFKAYTALVEHGAKERVENVLGNTLLHHAAKLKFDQQCVDLFKKIIDAGVDIKAKNIFNQTPFEIMLHSKNATVAGIKFFLDHGYCANAFNPITEKGFIAMTFSTHSYDTFQQKLRPVFEEMIKACGSTLDKTGRTLIHNIVSTSTSVISDEFYLQVIESLIKVVDIDHQDNLGRTALHVATQFKNHRAISALLQAGVDINIIDENKKTAFVYAFETAPFIEGSQDDSTMVVKMFSQYVQKLNVCGLDVHEVNHGALSDAIQKYNVNINVIQRFYDELDQMKNIKLRSSSATLLNLISGTNGQSVSSCISRLDRNLIDKLFKSIDKERFRESLGMIRLQCRKLSKKNCCTVKNLQ